MNIAELNQFPEAAAREELLRCCHSARWVDSMLARRPFKSFDDLLKASDECFTQLTREDWLDAFAGHAKIGDVNSLRAKYGNAREWSAGEQAGVNDALEEVLQGLAAGNTEYEKRFGHIFIVCATGKTAAQMLDLLHARIDNDPAEELKLAGNEQSKITRIRLEKLCQEVPSQPTC